MAGKLRLNSVSPKTGCVSAQRIDDAVSGIVKCVESLGRFTERREVLADVHPVQVDIFRCAGSFYKVERLFRRGRREPVIAIVITISVALEGSIQAGSEPGVLLDAEFDQAPNSSVEVVPIIQGRLRR